MSGRFRVTNGIEPWRGDPSGWSIDNLQPNIRDVTTLVDRITQILPMLAGIGFSKVWGGLIDLTPDALPVIDAHTGVEGLIIAAGFSGHGFGIGPVTGEILSDLAQGRQPRFALAEFRCDRFGSAQHWPSLTLHG